MDLGCHSMSICVFVPSVGSNLGNIDLVVNGISPDRTEGTPEAAIDYFFGWETCLRVKGVTDMRVPGRCKAA